MGKATDSHGTLPDKRQGIETLSDPQPNNKLMYIAYIEYIEWDLYTYIYMHTCISVCTCTYIFIYMNFDID